jgi:pilus assembly protein Flp/PilA
VQQVSPGSPDKRAQLAGQVIDRFRATPALRKQLRTWRTTVTNLIMKSLSQLHRDEAGQGLVEYALIIALVAFAAVVGMNTLAADINDAFSKIGSVLDVNIP